MAGLFTLLSAGAIRGGVIFESAPMGSPGPAGSGTVVGSNASVSQFVGVRFTLNTQTLIHSVGGYVRANGNSLGPLFAAIVSLDASTGFPSGYPFSGSPLVSTTFLPSLTGADQRTPVSALLAAGSYGLVFGAGMFGSPLGGEALLLDPGAVSNASYFAWTSIDMPGFGQIGNWGNLTGVNARFVIEGTAFAGALETSTPEPGSFLLGVLGLGIAALIRKSAS